jgi:Flp pilus assembly protein TadD
LAARITGRGPDHPEVATSLNNLGVLARRQGRLAEAERLHRRALAIRLAALGPDHPDVAQSQHNLGRTLLDAGDIAGATALFELAGTPGPKDWFGLDRLNSAAEALGSAGEDP